MTAMKKPVTNGYTLFFSFYTKCSGTSLQKSLNPHQTYENLCGALDTLANVNGLKKRVEFF